MNIVILGAHSDLAKSLATIHAKKGDDLVLLLRNNSRLKSFASDLSIRYSIKATLLECDVLDINEHKSVIKSLPSNIAIFYSIVGLLGDQIKAQSNHDKALEIMSVNYTAPALFLNALSLKMQRQKSGVIVGVSSVAGDRGRASNYIYGSAKSAFTSFLSGLRNRLSKKNIHVLTVKPGFMATQMTKALNLPKLLTLSPDYAALKIISAVKKRKDCVYLDFRWAIIMSIIKNIPERIFKKMSL